MKRLDGLVCLVTGSTGFAEAAAVRFGAEGGAVFVVSRTAAHCAALVERVQAAGGRAAFSTANLVDETEVDAAITACVEHYGRVDGLFSVAGGSGRSFGDGPIHALSADGWDRTIELNLRSQALVARATVRQMLAQEPRAGGRRGSILFMSSVSAFHPVPEFFGTHAYAAAKGGIDALTTAMAAAYAPSGIRVNAVAPGVAATPMARRAATDPEIVAFAEKKQPLVGGLLDADDVAPAAVYFLGDESRAVTGQVLGIDGGWSVTSVGSGRGAVG